MSLYKSLSFANIAISFYMTMLSENYLTIFLVVI